jgi:prepilin peptidase CpaA
MFHDLAITQVQAITFGLLTLPITIWIVATDVMDMKIKNGAVLATFATFVLAGPFVLPLDTYAWRYLIVAAVLAAGFVLSLTGGLGAGDAKYVAAVSPLIATPDLGAIAVLYLGWAMFLLAGMAAARRSRALRTSAPGWVWFQEDRKRHIPFGLTLAPTASSYFFLGAIG